VPVPAARGVEGELAFVLNVPDHRYELDLDPATRSGSIRRLVEDRVRGVEQLWSERRTIRRLLEEQAAAAHDSGASYSAASRCRPTRAR
jgi:hypothetical protein